MDHAEHKPVKSPVCWMGGKAKHAGKIVKLFPEHLMYIEPFGGGGHVLCHKAPSQGEVYNDLDANLVNFFRVCRDDAEALQRRLQHVPYSRRQFNEWRALQRSERWRESEKGQAAAEFVSAWENFDAEQFDLDEPSEVEAPDAASDALNDLPSEPDAA